MIPKFHAQLDWCNSGNVSIYFDEPISCDVQKHIGEIINNEVHHWQTDRRTTYHLEEYVASVFTSMVERGDLKRDLASNIWFLT